MFSIAAETLFFMLIVGVLWYLLAQRGRVGTREDLSTRERILQSIFYALISGVIFQLFRYIYSLFLPTP